MKVLLIYPPLNKHTSYWHPHLGLGYIASSLNQDNHDVKVLDTVIDRISISDFENYIKKLDFDIVGITATTFEIKSAHNVANIIKRLRPNTTVIIGGAHATAIPVKTIEEFDAFDVAVYGEGEKTIAELISAIEKGYNMESVPGICFRENGEIKLTKPQTKIENLDSLSFPLWNKFPIRKYKGFMGLYKKVELPIMSGRGCPSQCIFCQRVLGNQVRFRSPVNVVDEIEYDLSLGAKSIIFCDETFTLVKKITLAICDEILRRGLNKKFEWHCETRVDNIDEETMSIMKKAGCKMIELGVETGDELILKKVKKGIEIKEIKRAFATAKKIGLKTIMNLIFGLPGETKETLKKTISLLMEINPDDVSIGLLVPFPGTEVYEMAKRGEEGLNLASNDWNNYGKQIGNALYLDGLSVTDLKKYQTIAYVKFYFRLSRIFNLFQLANLGGIYRLALDRIKDFFSVRL